MTRRFPRTARVRTRAEYDRIFQHGRRTALPVLALHWRPASPDPAADDGAPQAAMPSAGPGADPLRSDAARTAIRVEPQPPAASASHGRKTKARGAAGTSTAAVPGLPEAIGARLGLAVSRKVDRRAVVRNRIKRGLRETFRTHRVQLAPGEYVVVARPGAAALDAHALRRTLLTLLRRAGALPPVPPAGTMPTAACTDPVQPPSR